MWSKFYDAPLQRVAKQQQWDEQKHPRQPAGSDKGGEFAPKDAGGIQQPMQTKGNKKLFEDKIQDWKNRNIQIASTAPKTKPPENLQKHIDDAYSLGEKARKNGIRSMREAVRRGDYDREMSSYDMPEFVAFESGLLGKDKPYWVNGWRYGIVPRNGLSMNFAEGKLEAGLSVMALDNGLATQDPSFEMFGGSRGNQDRIYVSGFLNTVKTGGDGEPLLLWAKQTGYVKD